MAMDPSLDQIEHKAHTDAAEMIDLFCKLWPQVDTRITMIEQLKWTLVRFYHAGAEDALRSFRKEMFPAHVKGDSEK